MKAVYGAFTVEGAGAMPLTTEDVARIEGRFVHNGKTVLPHVMTNRGPFVFDSREPPRSPPCPECGARKLIPKYVTQWGVTFERWCFGCGRGS